MDYSDKNVEGEENFDHFTHESMMLALPDLSHHLKNSKYTNPQKPQTPHQVVSLSHPIQFLSASVGGVPELHDASVWLNKSLTSPIVNQGGCGSCWAVSLSGAISDRYMVQQYLEYMKLDPTSSHFPHFKNSHTCEDTAYNYEYMASPSQLLRNMTPSHRNYDVEGWQCCGGTSNLVSIWHNLNKGQFDYKIVNLLQEGKLQNMSSCPYNKDNWFSPCKDSADWEEGWLPMDNKHNLCNQKNASEIIDVLVSDKFCGKDASLEFKVEHPKMVPAAEIPDALLGQGDFVLQGPGTIVTAMNVPKDFSAFGRNSSWLSVESPRQTHQKFTHVYCYDGDTTGGEISGGHAVCIAGFIKDVYIKGLDKRVDAYVIRNSWGIRIVNRQHTKTLRTKPWGDDGYCLWATSATWPANEQYGIDSGRHGKLTVAVSFKVTGSSDTDTLQQARHKHEELQKFNKIKEDAANSLKHAAEKIKEIKEAAAKKAAAKKAATKKATKKRGWGFFSFLDKAEATAKAAAEKAASLAKRAASAAMAAISATHTASEKRDDISKKTAEKAKQHAIVTSQESLDADMESKEASHAHRMALASVYDTEEEAHSSHGDGGDYQDPPQNYQTGDCDVERRPTFLVTRGTFESSGPTTGRPMLMVTMTSLVLIVAAIGVLLFALIRRK